MKSFLTLLIVITTSITYGQTMGTDSKGESVYEFQKSEGFNLPISSADNSIKVNFSWKLESGTQYFGRHSSIPVHNNFLKANPDSNKTIFYDTTKAKDGSPKGYSSNDSSRFTLAKSWGINSSLKVSNLLSNLAKAPTFHPKYAATLGIGRNIDAFNNWENIRLLTYPFSNWNFTLGLERETVKIYDTVTKKASDFNEKWTKSATFNGSIYFPRLFKKTLLGLSTVLTYKLGNNISDLKKYQDNKALYIDNNITEQGDLIGRIGDLTNQNSFRMAFSLDIFADSFQIKKETVQLCIMPYASFGGAVNSHFNKLVGLYVNVSQGGGLFANNSSIKPGIGAGVDWVISPNGVGDISIFVGGSLSIEKFFPHTKAGKNKTK